MLNFKMLCLWLFLSSVWTMLNLKIIELCEQGAYLRDTCFWGRFHLTQQLEVKMGAVIHQGMHSWSIDWDYVFSLASKRHTLAFVFMIFVSDLEIKASSETKCLSSILLSSENCFAIKKIEARCWSFTYRLGALSVLSQITSVNWC